MELKDTLFQQNLRHMVLNQIAIDQSISENVIEAMKKVPRHYLVDAYQQEDAYEDKPLQISSGQTISQITTVAIQTNLLNPKPGDKILEVGSGTGYQTAILHQMGCKVYSVERIKILHELAKENLSKMNLDTVIELFHGDGFEGLPKFAPFDGILVTCAAATIPVKLKNQLAIGGKLVIPIGEKLQEMTVIERMDEEEFNTTKAGFFNFVPMIPGTID